MKEDNNINEDIEIYGNYYDKYNSKNVINRLVVKNFMNNLVTLLHSLDYDNLLDVGCGEGYITDKIAQQKKCDIVGVDLGGEQINKAMRDYKGIQFMSCSIYRLPFNDNSFDLVTAIEIMEHLHNPARALKEMMRVAREWVILSVPNEPLWRILNLLSLRYLRNLGNTPGHINHWTVKGFNNLVGRYFKVIKIMRPLPWTMVLARK